MQLSSHIVDTTHQLKDKIDKINELEAQWVNIILLQ